VYLRNLVSVALESVGGRRPPKHDMETWTPFWEVSDTLGRIVADSDSGPAAANCGRVGDRRYFVLSVAIPSAISSTEYAVSELR
jgi:hypothetical protein